MLVLWHNSNPARCQYNRNHSKISESLELYYYDVDDNFCL